MRREDRSAEEGAQTAGQPSEFSRIAKRWQIYKAFPHSLPMPGFHGSDAFPGGTPVILIENTAACCIDDFIMTRGRLDASRLDALRECTDELRDVLENYGFDERTANRLRSLQMICEMVLREAVRRRSREVSEEDE